MRSWMSVSIAVLAVLSGCGDRPVFGPGRNTEVDAARLDAPSFDAGRDAADAFGLDAPDAPMDAGLLPDVLALDGDLPDATLPDAPLPDARLPDAALPDARLPDAPLPDVRLPDAALPDAGLSDAGRDAGMDAGRDAGADAGSDAGRDAATDAGTDAPIADAGRDAPSTDAPSRLGPAPVVLGPPGDLTRASGYVVLAETMITNVIGSMIDGNVGISPGASTDVTGFALILDSSGRFSSSSAVVPPAHVYAADHGAPTPANLMTAMMGMEAAYTDAAGRTGPNFSELALGHIGGLVLVPGLYRWTTAVDVTTGITLAGGPDDVWIFQVGSDLDVSAAAMMLLTGGARAENVFWQVTGGVTVGAGARVEGIVLSQTSIRMESGAVLHGRAFAQTFVALDNDNITPP